MNSRIAMFPGSFDPVTYGHIDIVRRLSSMYELVYIVVAENRNKSALFSVEQRCTFLRTNLDMYKNVIVLDWSGLIVDFAKKYNVGVVVRGIRNTADFDYEFEVCEFNKKLCPELEFIFMPTGSGCSIIRSSSIKELASFHADISQFVPKDVCHALIEKFKG